MTLPHDESVARERIAMLELSATAHEQEGRAVMAGECRRSAALLRDMWGLPGGGP